MTALCECPCHIGSVLALHIAPLLSDPIAAATACAKCLPAHCPALLDMPDTPPKYRPWRDSFPQADGEGFE